MATARTSHRSAAGRVTPAVIGLFALLIQALLPAAALAGQPPAARETLVICTAGGPQTVAADDTDDGRRPGFAGLPCPDCLAGSTAALPPPDLAVAPVAYASGRVEHRPAADENGLRWARPPPRPPSRAPPAPLG
ncbi:DUF2946 family protein [Phenylobacterium sp.]|uniref:DUF2946 family protein n=1 Tax=Phenylobacterium sp. TaxID=1871053 RepID=UPI0035ADDEAC